MKLEKIKQTPHEKLRLECQALCEDILMLDDFINSSNLSRVLAIESKLDDGVDTLENLNDWIPELQDMKEDAQYEEEERIQDEEDHKARMYDLEPWGDTYVKRFS